MEHCKLLVKLKLSICFRRFKTTWAGLIKQNQAEIFNTLANGVNIAKTALQGLTPFLSGVAKGMEQASAKMLDWAKNSQVAQKFFQMMGTTGVRIFNNMLNAAGQFGSGIISILTQLAPLAEWVSKGFEKWALHSINGLKVQQAKMLSSRSLNIQNKIYH